MLFSRKPRLLAVMILMLVFLGGGLLLPPLSARAAPPAQIITNTPMEDGAVVHFVEENETLVDIAQAYGVTIADLRGMNGMAADSSFISVGQRLTIRLAQPPTATPTITPTIPRPTRTPTQVIPSRTPRPTRTPVPTLTPSPTPHPLVAAGSSFLAQNRRSLLLALLGVSLLGLIWTLWAGFRPSRLR